MFILDSLLIGGLRFVFDKIATIADSELNDPTKLQERLLAGEMQLELGEISQAEFDVLEADILARMREIRERQMGGEAASPEDFKVTGIEASFEGDEH